MSLTHQPDTDSNEAVARRTRKTRTSVPPTEVLDALHAQSDLLAQARALIEAQGQSLAEINTLVKSFQDSGIAIQTPEGVITLCPGKSAKPADVTSEPELATDQYLVHSVFMDFLEIHSALAKSFRDRRPMLGSAVQARYSDNAEPVLMIMRKGEFGTNNQMYNTALTLRIHDDEPYIDGDYMDFGKTVSMSEEQVKRCVSTILDALRKETSDTD